MEENFEISYRNLRRIQQMEKNSPVLSDLTSGFYDETSAYLLDLDKRLGKESSSQKKMLIADEIQDVKKIVLNIYEQREKKILLAVVSKARGGNPDTKKMLDVEKNLFDSVLSLLTQKREKFFEGKTKKKQVKETPIKTDNEKENIKEEIEEKSNPVVLIKKDVPEFVGTDAKKYNLRKNDVISMPENMSSMLIKRNVAEKINE